MVCLLMIFLKGFYSWLQICSVNRCFITRSGTLLLYEYCTPYYRSMCPEMYNPLLRMYDKNSTSLEPNNANLDLCPYLHVNIKTTTTLEMTMAKTSETIIDLR